MDISLRTQTNIIEDFQKYFCEIDGNTPTESPAGFLLEVSQWLAENDSNRLLIQDYPSSYDGWKLLDELAALPNCMVLDPLLELVWYIFDFETNKTDWHPWFGQFDPLYGIEFTSVYGILFRKGFLKYHGGGASDIGIFNFAYDWWPSPSDLVGELRLHLDQSAQYSFCKSLNEILTYHERRLKVETFDFTEVDLRLIQSRIEMLISADDTDNMFTFFEPFNISANDLDLT